ncbi:MULTISPECIES: tripartite tricarboxylate transporter substrate binding protein [unclassified Variovorax]|uniref:Bug family tripartite tricarboxylate transporter substrate binding protein n=1 Tax=unclassified Variovorax TaxID=663243 RepID=UPI002578BC28|nr:MULTISPECIES: tripartite tricarboxylate transporter substrate binding protein [unclassified Variovorax]MDM0091221.1 tripartite tricarboxylate transporter substrate binding protein [Variovorax sp. J22G40]MDM0149552.1 tripartite tricarboxylate transporter substrate binding protein [Variovorax sp. J2P1-31]
MTRTPGIPRRLLLNALAPLAALACLPAAAQAPWPAKPIRLVVPFPAGGPTDIAARVIGQALGEVLKTPVFVENKGGAHGFIGAADAAKSAPDGYTLMMASIGTMAINPRLYSKLPYDANQGFAPVSLVLTVPIVVVVNPKVLPVKTVPELVAYLKANPNKVNFASAGNGGSSHLVPEYFKYRTGTAMTHIPYKGSGPAVADLVSGQVQIMFDTLLTSTPFVKSGALKMLAVTTPQRLADYPEVPTMAEALGMKDFDASSWYAMYAPAGTPAPVVQRLSATIDAVLKQPAVAQRLAELGAVPVGGPPERLAAFQRAEQDKWGKVIQAADVRPD